MDTRLVNTRRAVRAALLVGVLLVGLAACGRATASPMQPNAPKAVPVVTQPAHGGLNADRYYEGANLAKDRSARNGRGSINADRYYEDANLAHP
jgi:hypothetical protein